MEGRIYKDCLEKTVEWPLADGTGAKLLGEMVAELLLGSAPAVTWRSGVAKLGPGCLHRQVTSLWASVSSFLKLSPGLRANAHSFGSSELLKLLWPRKWVFIHSTNTEYLFRAFYV